VNNSYTVNLQLPAQRELGSVPHSLDSGEGDEKIQQKDEK
jgi:hypothetical protein